MTNLAEIIKAGAEAVAGSSWQGQAGQIVGVAVLTILGGVVGWFGKRFKDRRKKKTEALSDFTIAR